MIEQILHYILHVCAGRTLCCPYCMPSNNLVIVEIVYVTGFVKTCIVHTSTFSTLKIHKICYAHQTNMQGL